MDNKRRKSEDTLPPIVPIATPKPLSSLLSFSLDLFDSKSHHNLQWYDWWVRNQVHAQPKELFSAISTGERRPDSGWTQNFGTVWQETARYLTANESSSIDSILSHLLANVYFEPGNDSKWQLTAKNLVFALVGWQTMLYKPEFRSCPVSQLAIESQMGLHQGQCHMSLKQSESACKKPMHEFLLGYGVLLPPRQFCAPESTEEKEAFNKLTNVSPDSFNAHFLTLFGGVHIEWVDSLPCHLEFDSDANTLFLFRYPSFCVAKLEAADGSTKIHKSVLHACAAL